MGTILDLVKNNTALGNIFGLLLAIAIPGLVLFFWKRSKSIESPDNESDR